MAASDYIAYFDESGDHGMEKIDPSFPVFVLAGWVFKIQDFLAHDLSAFTKIKFDHFGHDNVVFHSRDIRKQVGPFQILSDKTKRLRLMSDIANFYLGTTGILIAAGIDKKRHLAQYSTPVNPYDLSLLFCLERVYAHLKGNGEVGRTMFCIFEARGPKEDAELAHRFNAICAGDNQWGALPFKLVFADKRTNLAGLQIADLAAYPIARHVINAKSSNPAYDRISPKFRKSSAGKIIGWGLKVFP